MTERPRGRPSKALLSTMRSLGKSRVHIAELVRVTVSALLQGQQHITLKTHRITKFEKGFPKGICIERDGDFNVYHVRALKLLEWLNKKGYTDITAETIRVARIKFTQREQELDL